MSFTHSGKRPARARAKNKQTLFPVPSQLDERLNLAAGGFETQPWAWALGLKDMAGATADRPRR